MVWGGAYWQLFKPMAEQKWLSTRKVQLFETVYTNYVRVRPSSVTIVPIDRITEGEVNGRVNTYAVGAVDDLIFQKVGTADMLVDTYNSYVSSNQVAATNRANSNFREGPY